MKLFILFILIIIIVVLSKKQEREERDRKIEENKQFELSCAHHGNKSILNKLGKDKFIMYFGKEQYDKVIAGTDTKIVEMLEQYKNKI